MIAIWPEVRARGMIKERVFNNAIGGLRPTSSITIALVTDSSHGHNSLERYPSRQKRLQWRSAFRIHEYE